MPMALGLGLSPCLGGRRPGFDPLSLSPLVWWDFGSVAYSFTDTGRTTNVAADGDAIAGAADRSGHGLHLSQATANRRPLWKSSVRGSLSAALFDGSNDFFSLASALTLAGDFTLFFAASLTGDCGLLGSTLGGTPQARYGRAGANVLSFHDGAAEAISAILGRTQGDWTLLEVVRAGSTVSFLQDGIAFGTGAAGGLASFDVLGGLLGGTANLVTGYLGECLALGSADPDARVRLRTYLQFRWQTP